MRDNNMTAVEWLVEELGSYLPTSIEDVQSIIEQAKERERLDIENKAIHFAEWLTDKHVTALMVYYELFIDEEYGGK
jgi:hypothetical protein